MQHTKKNYIHSWLHIFKWHATNFGASVDIK